MKRNKFAKWTVAIALALTAGSALAGVVCYGRFNSKGQFVGMWCCNGPNNTNCGYVAF